MNAKKKQIPEIAALNVLFCLLVIFIHVSSHPVTTLEKGSWQHAIVYLPWRLSGFAVQGFIFLSGLKTMLNHKDRIDYKRFYLSRLTRILIPYVIWNVIYYLYFISIGYFGFSFSALGKYLVTGTLVSPFYFIIIITQFYLLMPLWRWMVKKLDVSVALVFSILITLLCHQFLPEIIRIFKPDFSFAYNDRVFTSYFIYWVIGIYAGHSFDKFKTLIRGHTPFFVTVFLVIAPMEGLLNYFGSIGKLYVSFLELLHLIYCLSAVFFFYSLFSHIYEKRSFSQKPFVWVNEASYEIYLMHCLFINIINGIMRDMGIVDIAVSYAVRILFVYVLSVTLSVILTRTKRKLSAMLPRHPKP